MKCFEERQQLAMQMVAVLWKMAHEYANEHLYNEIRTLMEKVIISRDTEELEEAMEPFDEKQKRVEEAAKSSLWYMEHNWKMQHGGDAK